jgi:hypothetical protein
MSAPTAASTTTGGGGGSRPSSASSSGGGGGPRRGGGNGNSGGQRSYPQGSGGQRGISMQTLQTFSICQQFNSHYYYV